MLFWWHARAHVHVPTVQPVSFSGTVLLFDCVIICVAAHFMLKCAKLLVSQCLDSYQFIHMSRLWFIKRPNHITWNYIQIQIWKISILKWKRVCHCGKMCCLFFSWFILPYLSPPPRLVLHSVCFHTIKANLHPLRWVVGGSPGAPWRLTDHINQSFSLWLSLSCSLLCLSVCLCLHITVSRLTWL